MGAAGNDNADGIDDADANDDADGNDADEEIDDSDDAITIGSGKLSGYGKQVQEFVRGHKAEIAQFVADNKQALADAKAEIAEAIKTGDFDYAHYQQQLQQFVTEHDLGAYRERLDAFVAVHRAEIAQFVADNKQAVADVQEDIDDLVATGEFDFAHYKEQIQDLVDRFDEGLSKYAGTDHGFEESAVGAGAGDGGAAGQEAKKTLMGYASTGQYEA